VIRIKVFTIIITWLLIEVIISGCGRSISPVIIRTVVSEKLVTEITDAYSSSGSSIAYSLDGKHIAYHATKGEKECVIVDETSKEYDRASSVVWDSSDHFHYLVQLGNSIYLVGEIISGQ
jgi:hypothetical protein